MLARCWEKVPGVSVSSDFIVGFSGESEQSFQRSCDLVAEAGFKNSYIFKYSPRPGTKGYELYADDIPEEVKKRRNNDLLAIQNKASLEDHQRRIGQMVEVLVEGPSKTFLKDGWDQTAEQSGLRQLTGRTPTDHIVVFEGNDRLIGETIQVTVREATAFTLFGTVVTGEFLMRSAEGGMRNASNPESSLSNAGIPLSLSEPSARISLPLI
jgi:tRNA-2-methylthio-N6-dimethylallyladenosine synthase